MVDSLIRLTIGTTEKSKKVAIESHEGRKAFVFSLFDTDFHPEGFLVTDTFPNPEFFYFVEDRNLFERIFARKREIKEDGGGEYESLSFSSELPSLARRINYRDLVDVFLVSRG